MSSAQLASAFDGRLTPVRTSAAYRLSTSAVLVVLLLLPVCYVGLIAAAAAGVAWYAVHGTAVFGAIGHNVGLGGGRVALLMVVVYVAPLIAGALVVAFMVLPLFRRRQRRQRPMWVDRREQPLLYAYVEKLCDAMRVPRPARIDVLPTANASAHIDNGLAGLLRRRLVLTVGLPIAATMDVRGFTAVLAHEFGHFAQGGTMRASYAVHRINGWFIRLGFGRTAADDLVAQIAGDAHHWTGQLVAATCYAALGMARLILKGLATVSHATSMHLSRQAEFDADRRSARIVGSDAMAAALEAMPYLHSAADLAVAKAQAGWGRRRLPDDLVVLTDAFARAMPTTVRAKIEAGVLAHDARWFDTHPPLFQRIAALKWAADPGVLRLDAPASCLFRDFDELCKLATIGMYQASPIGQQLQPEHLVPVEPQATRRRQGCEDGPGEAARGNDRERTDLPRSV